jgi:hypothetical protein
MDMKKQNYGNQRGFIPFLLAASLLLPFLAACSSEESVQNGTENAGGTYTFTVSETVGDDTLATRSAMTPQTVTRDLGNGMTLVGTLTEESGAATRSTTPLTSGSGKAYVCASDGTITNVQDITLSGSSLTVHCPKASGSSKIYFLLGTAPAATVGSNISAVTTTGVSTNWNYLYASADVPTSSDAIGTLTFHHIFTQAQVTMTSSNASTTIGGFNTSVSGIAKSTATLCANGSYTASGSAASIGCTASGGTGTSLSNSLVPFISTTPGSSTSATLTVGSITYGGTTYNYTTGNTLAFSGTFAQGHRYNFAVTLKESYKKTFTISDYYQWDAYSHYVSGNYTPSTTYFKAGKEGYNPSPKTTNTPELNSALQSCKDCPTGKELYAYLLAGAYIDDGSAILISGSTYSYPPAYTINGTTYNNYNQSTHTLVSGSTGLGLWLPKNSYIKSTLYTKVSGLTAGQGVESYTGAVAQNSNMLSYGGTVNTAALATSIRNSGNYFYLPAAGYYNGSLSYTGTYGGYWASSTSGSSVAYDLFFYSGNVRLSGSNRNYGFLRWGVQ